MAGSLNQADNLRQRASLTRRLTRSTRKGLPHLMLAGNKAVTIEQAPMGQVNDQEEDMWTEVEHINLTSIESDPSMDEPAEEQGSPGSIDSTNTVTSKYTPVKYPIFPPLIWGPEEDEPDTWEMHGPSHGLVRTAPMPKPLGADTPEPMIILKGSDTMLPGSPGYLPESIPAWKWWRDVQNKGNDTVSYVSMVKYSERTARLRIPIKDVKEPNKPRSQSIGETLRWYTKFLDDPPQ